MIHRAWLFLVLILLLGGYILQTTNPGWFYVPNIHSSPDVLVQGVNIITTLLPNVTSDKTSLHHIVKDTTTNKPILPTTINKTAWKPAGKPVAMVVANTTAQYPERLFYNRIPKCGSSALMFLLQTLSKKNRFRMVHSKIYDKEWLNEVSQLQLMRSTLQIRAPMVYERHIHFLDYTRYGLGQPGYINLVRNPLDRLVSAYYFHRYQHIKKMNLFDKIRTFDECVLYNISECTDPVGRESFFGYFHLIPYFCGQDSYCRTPGDRALQKAKENVQKYYVVVGIMEEYEKSLRVLEHLLPSYFNGSLELYKTREKYTKKKFGSLFKLPVTAEVSRIMKVKLKEEYIFYNFLRQRLLYQASVIDKVKTGTTPRNKSKPINIKNPPPINRNKMKMGKPLPINRNKRNPIKSLQPSRRNIITTIQAKSNKPA